MSVVMIDYAAQRLAMVESQLRTNRVMDEAILEAFLAVPRERFVPPALSGIAYVDDDLPIGAGRYLMEPMVLARLLQLAAIGNAESVLEIGCATGYGTALLARLARQVVAVESDRSLAGQAVTRLRELGVTNAAIVEGPLTEGYAARAPYDVILFEGAVARLPETITNQLVEGGRLLCVLQEGGGMGRAHILTRIGGLLSRRAAFDAAVPLLPGFQAEPSFVF
jgi:protein-L-isoaspartate(D-aspartate) O-methyltransferase